MPSRLEQINAGQQGQRIDNFLIKTLKDIPRSRLYRMIRKGEVRVNKKRIRPEYKLQTGDLVRIPPLRQQPEALESRAIPADLCRRLERAILFEDDKVLAIDKPAGLAVHSGSGLRYGLIDVVREIRPGSGVELVHRLDRDTSGCLLLAKNRQTLLLLQDMLKSGSLRKLYLAIVKGHWPSSLRSVDLPLKRMVMPNSEKKVIVDDRGQQASTRILDIEHFSRDGVDYSRLRIQLLTGRTHQIRVHCQSQGHEIAGDPKYGDREFNRRIKALGCRRMCLHASELDISATAHTNAVRLTAPEPDEFTDLTRNER